MNTVEPRAPYPMSMLRGALHSFAKLYGDRYARHNISMNNLMPGFCENVNLSEYARKSIPAQRPATFEEIGKACVFLASDEARYITAQTVNVDGGNWMSSNETIEYQSFRPARFCEAPALRPLFANTGHCSHWAWEFSPGTSGLVSAAIDAAKPSS